MEFSMKTEKIIKCGECGHEKTVKLKTPPEPSFKEVVEFDFLKIREFIGDHIDGGDDILWNYACEYWDLSNDSYLSWYLDENELDDPDCDKERNEVLKLFFNYFIKPYKDKNIMFWVCW